MARVTEKTFELLLRETALRNDVTAVCGGTNSFTTKLDKPTRWHNSVCVLSTHFIGRS